MAHRFFTLDVFTDTPLAGNPLAIVLDADDLDGRAMQRIAREFNLSETVFVAKPQKAAHNARIRIFTPHHELPFAGHPTVGAAVLLVYLKFGDAGQEQDAMVVLEEEIGIVRAGVRLMPKQAPFAVFDLPRLPQANGRVPQIDDIAHALGLMPSDIGFANHKPSIASAGVPFLFVPVKGREALARARTNRVFWDEMMKGEGPGGAFVYCGETENKNHAFRARMFAPGMGVEEDPATGAAAAALAHVVTCFDSLADGEHKLWIEQGYEMGRPSLIALEVELVGGALSNVRIGGHAVILQEGTIRL